MMNNRLNHYQILHVQPDAPVDIIRASFRTLMTKLRHHPDLGGNHDTAVLLNVAYAVLSDPSRREQYDRTLQQARAGVSAESRTASIAPERQGPASPENPQPPSDSQAKSGADMHPAPPVANDDKPAPIAPAGPARTYRSERAYCAFCGLELPAVIYSDTRCHQCESPQAPPPASLAGGDTSSCRRAFPRVSKTDAVLIYEGWKQRPYGARLRDLSLSGISIIMDTALRNDAVLRIVGPSFDVLAVVVACRKSGESHTLHARLLSAILAERPGVFVSMTV